MDSGARPRGLSKSWSNPFNVTGVLPSPQGEGIDPSAQAKRTSILPLDTLAAISYPAAGMEEKVQLHLTLSRRVPKRFGARPMLYSKSVLSRLSRVCPGKISPLIRRSNGILRWVEEGERMAALHRPVPPEGPFGAAICCSCSPT